MDQCTERWPDSGYILKTKPVRMEYKRKRRKPRMTKALDAANKTMNLPSTEMGGVRQQI